MRGARHRRVLVPAQARTLVALWLRLRIAMSCGMVTSLSRQVISRGKFRSRSVSAWSLAGSKGIVRAVEPLPGERELRLVVQLLRDDI